ncbi:MAG: putative serine protease HtrA [Candidatus Accumulibacter regalis]|uniref:Serine protease HtrA n=1 Tax=Accumulibacter regalis TaxID=522306 RepID=A0A011R392_ACCRE|nr:serine protease [Accumulibacter sp.]EXI85659.1 MAG: putative serine protease HtrA [Candidatus Accumulibacter regalis]HRE72970.1 tetratricopeptide repeat protein [Accumulibacter sp.]
MIPGRVSSAALIATACASLFSTATAADLSPEQLFAMVSPAVVSVRAVDDQGGELAQGSGVVVGPEQVATNCHVVRDATQIRIEAGTQALVGRWTRVDGQRDVCLLTVDGLKAKPVALRSSDSLQVGERVLAVGNPLGFGLAASSGLLVGKHDGDKTLLTSAAISPGSSGGGLFDGQGRLIGFTTAILGTGQNLNLVLSADGVDRLSAQGQPPPAAPAIPSPEPRWRDEATALVSKSDWPALAAHARRWLQAQPTSALAYIYLAQALDQSGRHQEAAAAAEESLRLDPYSSTGWTQKAVLAKARGDHDAAEAALVRAIELRPSNATPRRIRADWLFAARRFGEARVEAQAATRFAAGEPSAWSRLGAIEDALGQHADAAHAYRIALRLDQQNDEIRQQLAQALAKQGKSEDARRGVSAPRTGAADAGDAPANANSEAATWRTIGFSELERKRYGPAQDAFRKALQLAPEAPDAPGAWNGLGTALTHLNRLAEAEQAYDEALRRAPKNAEARANRASVRSTLGQQAAALEDIRQATSEAPLNANVWRIFGAISLNAKNYPDAVAAFSQLDALQQATPDDLVSLGESLAAVGRLADGLSVLRRAEAAKPQPPRLPLSMAKVLGESGDVTAALPYIELAIAAQPSSPEAWSSKGYALMRLGRLPEARDALETTVRLAPELVNGWINLGQVQLRSGNLARAIEALEKAIALKPDALDGRLYLAQSYLGARLSAKAREQASVVLARLPDQPGGLSILTMSYLLEGNAAAAAGSYARLKASNPTAALAMKAQAQRAGLSAAAQLTD